MVEVTVAMAVFNAADRLQPALDSILSQEDVDFDILIVDDCSDDGSEAILTQYAHMHPTKIRVVRNVRNLGLAASLNLILSLTDSTYVARMDADDVAASRRLRMQLDYLKAHPEVDVLGTAVVLEGKDGGAERPFRLKSTHSELYRRRYRECPVLHPTVMFRRAAVSQVGGYDPKLRRGQDYDLWIRMLRTGSRFSNLPDIGLIYSPPTSAAGLGNARVSLRILRHAVDERHWAGALWSLSSAAMYLISRSGLFRVGIAK